MTSETASSQGGTEHKEHHAPSVVDAARLVANLRSSMAHHELVEGKNLSPLIAYLSVWQSVRLSRTHADLLRDPRFSQACQFFLSDIYAPRDFSQRDYDGHRIYNFMRHFLPEQTLHPLAKALEVNAMTQHLDLALAEAMAEHLGVVDRFETWQYEEAYRLCNNYDERLRQITLITEVGKYLEKLRHLPFIGTTLRVARGPAHRLGWFEMQDFLERGFVAWKSLRQPDLFLESIESKEKAILNRIYGHPGGAPASNPFLFSDGGPAEMVLPSSIEHI